MDNKLRGSDLTRAMLERGDEKVWCAVHNDSDEYAMTADDSHAFTANIVAFKDGCFYCAGNMRWLYAVPIKIKEILQHETMY